MINVSISQIPYKMIDKLTGSDPFEVRQLISFYVDQGYIPLYCILFDYIFRKTVCR